MKGKNKMLNSIIGDSVTVMSLLICLFSALVLGVLTAKVFLYKCKHTSSFAITLALLPMAVAVVIMLVNGNIGTGVAVAGAFALVRFRSVPGTAREIAAIFTAMALGLALGMGYIGIAFIFFAVIGICTLVLTFVDFGGNSNEEKQLKITLPENYDYNGLFDDVLDKFTTKRSLDKVRTTNMGTLYELTYSITLPEGNVPKEFIDELRTRNGNLNIVVGDPTSRDSL